MSQALGGHAGAEFQLRLVDNGDVFDLDVGQHVGIIPVFLVWMVVWGDMRLEDVL